MSARELVEARARLIRAGIERARRRGADDTRRVLQRRLSEACGEGERLGQRDQGGAL